MKMDFEGTVTEFPFTPPWTVLGDDGFHEGRASHHHRPRAHDQPLHPVAHAHLARLQGPPVQTDAPDLRMLAAMQLVRRVMGIAGGALLALALASGALGLWLALATHAFAADVERVEGVVVGQRESAQPGGRSAYTPRIAFVARDGRRHEFTGQLSAGVPRFATGAAVPVVYRRADPAGARVDLFVDNWLGASVALGLAVATALAGFVLRRSTRA
jgi:hypothetical protein